MAAGTTKERTKIRTIRETGVDANKASVTSISYAHSSVLQKSQANKRYIETSCVGRDGLF